MLQWLEKLQKKQRLKHIPTKILKSLMTMYIQRKAVPQLLHILKAVCHHRLFDLSVCRTYIQLCRKYPVHLIQIFKALKANNLQPAVVDISVLLKAFLQDRASIHHLWEVLCYCSIYQDAPLELVEKAVGQTQTVISNKNILKLVNCWVMTTPSSFLCKLKPETLLRLQTFLHQEPAHCLQQAQGFDLELAVRFLVQIQNKEEDPLFISHLSDVLLRSNVLLNAATFLNFLQEKIKKESGHLEESMSCIRRHLSQLGSLLLAGCCGQQGDDVTEKLLQLLKDSPLVDKPQMTCCQAHSKTQDQSLEGKQKVSDCLKLDRSATATEPAHDHIQRLLRQQPSTSNAASSYPQQVFCQICNQKVVQAGAVLQPYHSSCPSHLLLNCHHFLHTPLHHPSCHHACQECFSPTRLLPCIGSTINLLCRMALACNHKGTTQCWYGAVSQEKQRKCGKAECSGHIRAGCGREGAGGENRHENVPLQPGSW
ncbi:uncharacterized protein LOC112563604 [Pomacea canaliculata]|uniref:uncharacterized protein LOC112563604 n=1 Tax=Pomacea canaliculata TaxID=400727 RepID=UPI000D72E0D8|nr:uncharacterized protein LOC112563604 [Pomacea canaliculata]XP_025093510.1 uncharacterized protein LOC112563604 [Pomacea canaliculata]XP_025093511.1 uncharacterized protein LOC112563604 [Pomacea canaliculata]